jgi:neutral ceramidase
LKKLKAGAAIVEVTPQKPMFLHGYPHVARISEGTHDPLFASALILDNGEIQIGFCAVDLIFISREIAKQVRERIQKATGIPGQNLMLSASHTHSGPVIFSDIFYDPVVPMADPEYISYLEDKLVEAYLEAFQNKKTSKIGIFTVDGSGVGGNRRNKTATIDPEVPVMVVKESASDQILALSTVYCMHPTVLHEDSKLYSADFPGYTREYIRKELGKEVILLYHTGPSGNQSPRHFIKSNTFDEAERLGFLLGKRIVEGVKQLKNDYFKDWINLTSCQSHVKLPKKNFMSLEEAIEKEAEARKIWDKLQEQKAHVSEIRTAEVDWFGAEENKQLAKMAANGELDQVYQSVLPAELNVMGIDNHHFVFLPGELYVEYSRIIKDNSPVKTFVVSLSNGVLAGYLVTEKAEQEGGYEASNSIFSAKAGQIIVNKALSLLGDIES